MKQIRMPLCKTYFDFVVVSDGIKCSEFSKYKNLQVVQKYPWLVKHVKKSEYFISFKPRLEFSFFKVERGQILANSVVYNTAANLMSLD